jgi:AcrR family transcriptional regulator
MSATSAAAVEESESAAGARLTRKGQATRSRIVRTAADLIFQRGVASTSIDDVRRAAKVSGSQMTHYFQDKRSLIAAVISYQLDAVLEFHTQAKLGKLDSFEALQLWVDLNVQKVLERKLQGGCSFGSLAGQLVESDPGMRADLAAGYGQWAQIIRAGLAAMRRRGQLRADAKPEMLTSVLLAAHQGGSLLSQTKRDIAPLRDALNAALDYIYSYAAEGSDRRRRPRSSAPRGAQAAKKALRSAR